MKSYDYSHRQGVREISWIDFAGMVRKLTERLELMNIEAVVGIARGGLFPATACACMLRCEFYPVRITRRLNDHVLYDHPHWITPCPDLVAGKTIAVIDEIADSGETLAMVTEEIYCKGAAQVISACLVSHSWADPLPDIAILVSDALVIFPWDRQVYHQGVWMPHPEIAAALKMQDELANPQSD